MIPLHTLLVLHKLTFNKSPSTLQSQLYGQFPERRGFLYKDRNLEEFQASFILSLAQVTQENKNLDPVYFFIPKADREWMESQIRLYVKQLLTSLPTSERRLQYSDRLRLLLLGHQVHQVPEEPSRWAAYGFTSTIVPSWMANRLS